MRVSRSLVVGASLWSGLLLVWLLFRIGYMGPFILDDLLHFPLMSGGINDIESALKWVFKGGANATGRPISYLSFLIDDNAWPTSLGVFKRTNILIHMLNVVLVFVVVRQLAYIVGSKDDKVEYFALVLAFAWAIQPMHMSAVFLAVQRMTLLMGMFTLLGLSLYLKGRSLQQSSKVFLGGTCLLLSVVACGGAATFSKEPGILLCLYLFILEYTLLKSLPWPSRGIPKAGFIALLLLPLSAIIIFYVSRWEYMNSLFLKRDFDWYERLLTEYRVICSYIVNVIAPSVAKSGPYQDDFVISRGLFIPVSTFFSALFIFGLVLFATVSRKRLPLLSAGILFFLGGHLLEGTVLPIELYFEHRNYLPMLGLLAPLAALAVWPPLEIKNFVRPLVGLWVCICVFVAYGTANVWGNQGLQSLLWASYHPSSTRANIDGVRFQLGQGSVDEAKKLMDRAMLARPDSAGLKMYAFVLDRCAPDYSVNFLPETEFKELLKAIKVADFDHSISTIEYLTKNISSRRCNISVKELESIIFAYLENPKYGLNKSEASVLYQKLSSVYMSEGNYKKTIQALDEAYLSRPLYEIALNQVYLALTAGLPSEADRYLNIAKSSPRVNKYEFLWRSREIALWEQLVAAEKERLGNVQE